MLMASFMRRRILFVSLSVARLLLLEPGCIQSSHFSWLEERKQILNLLSCRTEDGRIQGEQALIFSCTHAGLVTPIYLSTVSARRPRCSTSLHIFCLAFLSKPILTLAGVCRVCAAGGAVCVICPTTVIPVYDRAAADGQSAPTSASPLEPLWADYSRLAAKYPLAHNPCFNTLADSVCVACMIVPGGNLHAYMNKKEAKALAHHLFSMSDE